MQYSCKELARPASYVPVLGKENLDKRPLLIGRAPPVDRDRDQQQLLAVCIATCLGETLQAH
jgi:hypothetical protein